MWAAYHNSRTITTLEDVVHLTLQIRRCLNRACPQFHRPYRPEAEGRLALPKHEFGLDVIAAVGALRYAQHRSLPEIHHHLLQRGVAVAPRTVSHLLARYDELLALSLTDTTRLQRITEAQGRVILALDGLQPDVGHEVLWVLRDCLSGEVLLARSLLSATQADLAVLLRTVRQTVQVPIVGVISDGQLSIRGAVAEVFREVPHQLCHFHDLQEAAKPIYAADRHAKKELKKRVRGVRPIERRLAGRSDPEAEVVRGYCAAVRSALTDDGRPPLEASGLKLHDRLSAIAASLEQGTKKGALPKDLSRLKALLERGLTDTAHWWPDVRVGYRWVHQVAHILSNQDQHEALTVQRRLGGLLGAMTRYQTAAGTLAPALVHFRKVTRSYWPGLFACYTVPDLPRTNNDLEQFFGSYRYHDRRTTGRKVASPSLVLSGSVCVIAAAATRLHLYSAAELAPENVKAWQELRQARETRRQQRTLRRRFRRDPAAYLAKLEADLLQLILPP